MESPFMDNQEKLYKNLEFFSKIALRIENEVNELKFWIRNQYDICQKQSNYDYETQVGDLASIVKNVNCHINTADDDSDDFNCTTNDDNNFDSQDQDQDQDSDSIVVFEDSSQNSIIDEIDDIDVKPVILDSFSIVEHQGQDQDPLSLPSNFEARDNYSQNEPEDDQQQQRPLVLQKIFISRSTPPKRYTITKRNITPNTTNTNKTKRKISLPEKLKVNNEEESEPIYSKKTRVCKICRKKCTNLNRHMEIHSVGNVYDCDYCSLKFRTKNSAEVHLRQYHRKQLTHYPFKCPIPECAMYFMVKSALDDHHQVAHVGLPCGFCEEIFNDKGAYKEHLERAHLMCGNVACQSPGPFETRNEFHLHKLSHRKKIY